MSTTPHVTVINNIPTQEGGCAGGCGCFVLVVLAAMLLLIVIGALQ